jgi:uncharacterized membrane protein
MLKVITRWLLALLFIGAGINHFWHPGFYLNIMPQYLPEPRLLVHLSGVVEIVLGLMLLVPRYRQLAA